MRALAPSALVSGFATLFALTILWVSILVLIAAHHDAAAHGGGHAVVLAAVEIVAALAFVVRRWRAPAAVVLIPVFAIATAVTAAGGSAPVSLLFTPARRGSCLCSSVRSAASQGERIGQA